MPAAAYGGRNEIMDMLAPAGPVYQAGTLSGNPVAMAAGLATLEQLVDEPPYERLDTRARVLEEGWRDAANKAGVAVRQNRIGSMQTLFFTTDVVTDYASAMKSDTGMYAKFFHGLLDAGVHLAPSQFEAAFVSTVHSEDDIESTIDAAGRVMETIA